MQPNNAYLLPHTRAEAAKGIMPREYTLAPRTMLYRFINADKPVHESANGPWWFEFEHYQTIKHFSSRFGYSLGYAARLFAAILYEWNEVSGVVWAEVKIPLMAWKGRGKEIIVGADRPLYHPELDPRDVNRIQGISSSGPAVSKMIPMQGPQEVYQLFIPGLGNRQGHLHDYLTVKGSHRIATG